MLDGESKLPLIREMDKVMIIASFNGKLLKITLVIFRYVQLTMTFDAVLQYYVIY